MHKPVQPKESFDRLNAQYLSVEEFMKRCALMLVLFVVSAIALTAQVPDGWKIRVDGSSNAADPDRPGSIQLMAMSGGFHAVTPQAGVFWNPANTAVGAYAVKGTFTLNKPSSHTNYYGLIVGGSDLEGASQRYTYFLVGQDGTFIVKRRDGANVSDIVGRTAHAAVRRPDASGKSVNDLEVRVGAANIDYVVNGTVVHTMPKQGAPSTDGIFGFRVNHQLDVQVHGLTAARP